MKYSIRGNLNETDADNVVSLLNNYESWRLVTKIRRRAFTFEVWLNSESDRVALFEELKPFVNAGGIIDWHECTHDEDNPQACVIAETYKG